MYDFSINSNLQEEEVKLLLLSVKLTRKFPSGDTTRSDRLKQTIDYRLQTADLNWTCTLYL